MPIDTHSPKSSSAKSVLGKSVQESLARSDDRDLTWGGHDRAADPGTPRRDQRWASRPARWQASFEPMTASAMAIQKGWLAEELSSGGTLLRPRGWGAAGIASDGLAPEALAGVFREGANIAPIWNRANGADTAVVALTWVDEAQGIFTRANGGIRDLGGLNGARLGLPVGWLPDLSGFPRAVALRGLLSGLEMAGLGHKQVTFVDVADGRDAAGRLVADWITPVGAADDDRDDQDDQVDALLSGEVDAIFLRSRAAVRALRYPRLRELIDLNQLADPLARLNSATLRPLVVDRSFLESHSDLVVRYLTVLLRTAAWAEHHHDEVVQLISSEVGGLRAEEVVEAHGPDVHRAFTPALTGPYVSALEEQKNFLRDWRFLPADFSVTNWVVADPLVEAQERVRRLPPLVG